MCKGEFDFMDFFKCDVSLIHGYMHCVENIKRESSFVCIRVFMDNIKKWLTNFQ